MKVRVHNWRNQLLKLVIDVPGVSREDKPVLARAVLSEGTGCWFVEDVRLSQHGSPSHYFCVDAERYHAEVTVSDEEAPAVRAVLREFREQRAGDQVEFHWCTFDGLVPGRMPDEITGGGVFVMGEPAPLCHTYKDMLAKLQETAEFWQRVQASEADPHVAQKVRSIKIDHPRRQPTQTSVEAILFMRRHEARDAAAAPAPRAAAIGRAP